MEIETEYYLTDKIRIYNDMMEYRENEESDFKPILKNNWHLILEDYGWEKFPRKWITTLNKLSKIKERNSLFGIFDSSADGDCFFHCISHSLNEQNIGTDIYYNSNDIRRLISDNITADQYDTIIGYYRIMKDADDFDEDWDPYSIKSINDFKEKIITSGHEYWGDYMLLQVLINTLNINIFILNSNSLMNDYSVYNTLNEYNPDYSSVFLIYEDMCHFKLVGYFNGYKMISYFTDHSIPHELKKLYNIN